MKKNAMKRGGKEAAASPPPPPDEKGGARGKAGENGAEDSAVELRLSKGTLERLRRLAKPGESDDDLLLRLIGKLEYIEYMERKVVDYQVKTIRRRTGSSRRVGDDG